MTKNSDITVGVIANPASGRDIRRLTAKASVVSISEKANMVQRLLSPLGVLGVGRVLMMPDTAGIAATVRRAVNNNQAQGRFQWPEMVFLEQDLFGGPEDSQTAARLMSEEGAQIIVILGGDGTHRVVASYLPDMPLATLSTGTNNVFPDWRESTITGIATALHATGRVDADISLCRNKQLCVTLDDRMEIALVDACITRLSHIGARAIWEADSISELFVCFAEADAIGLSSIAAMLKPIPRDEPCGTYVRCAAGGRQVLAPIAPGMLECIEVDHFETMQPGLSYPVRTKCGSIALDGEREIEFHPGQCPAVSLELNGPATLDVSATISAAIESGLMADWNQQRIGS
jgi:predicted polyphosphate/ATP-dependent NAD kinase